MSTFNNICASVVHLASAIYCHRVHYVLRRLVYSHIGPRKQVEAYTNVQTMYNIQLD